MTGTHAAAGFLGSLPHEVLRPSPSADEPPRLRWIRRGALALVTLGALLTLLWRIDVPYPWTDESATVAAVERSWSGLWTLLGGQDAPLVPFYVVAKLAHTALPWLSTLVAVRSVSAVAAAAAVACVYSLVVRRQGVLAAVLTSVVLVSLPGFIRWGQDARPYALMMLTTAAAWLAWSTYRRPTDPQLSTLQPWTAVIRHGWGYILLLGGSAVVSLFALFQWPAQLLADATQGAGGLRDRSRRALPTAMAMITAAVVFAFPLWIAATKGQGPSRSVPLSVREAARALNDVVVVSGQAWWLFILPAIGLVIALLPDRQRPLLGEYSALARIAMWWTFVPFVMNLLVGVVRPNLVRPRYLVPTLAPIAILTAIAILVLARLVARWVTARRPESTSQRPAIAAASVVVVLALVVQGVSVLPAQGRVHAPNGHNKRLGPLLRALDAAVAADPNVVIAISPGIGRALVHAVRPSLDAREPLMHFSDTDTSVWPVPNTTAQKAALVGDATSILWVKYLSGASGATPPAAPPGLARLGFRVVASQHYQQFWVSRLERP
jgi:4-amino-4-deoxy-L-arabinose transferase-like glycosyltransferase